jgi:glycerol-3-phosphate dehydrogenase
VVHVDHLPGTQVSVLSLVGGKWTTFRGFAESVADDALGRLGRSRRISTRHEPIGGGRDYPHDAVKRAAWMGALVQRHNLPAERAEMLFARYGTTAAVVAAYCANSQDGRADHSLSGEAGYTAHEIRYLCEHDMVTHLADLVFRRTTIAISGHLTNALLMEVSAIAAQALGWDAARTLQEIDATREIACERHGIALSGGELVRQPGA